MKKIYLLVKKNSEFTFIEGITVEKYAKNIVINNFIVNITFIYRN